MCGIFGLIVKKNTNLDPSVMNGVLRTMASYSESRGKDSSGLAVLNQQQKQIDVVKGDVRVRDLLKDKRANELVNNALNRYKKENQDFACFGHARLVTNGTQLEEVNNQPVIKHDMVLIHNGIIVNNEQLWDDFPDLNRDFSLDSEIILSLLNRSLSNGAEDALSAIKEGLAPLQGTFSIASYFAKFRKFVLATNNGSLYYITDNETFIVFGSEEYYLKKLCAEKQFKTIANSAQNIKQLRANQGLVLDIADFKFVPFELNQPEHAKLAFSNTDQFKIEKHLIQNTKHRKEVVIDPVMYINREKEGLLFNLLEDNSSSISKLKRCTKCVLPETFPFIKFDEKGVCNYCNNYQVKEYPSSLDELKKLIEPYKRTDGRPDCIVPFSGGRDSTYSLHIIKKELGLNPIAFTYDWGMVTDLARRNIARACGKLGVENIIVSADIHWKRENIRKNVSAWLKKPSLGMIPLFMAGDKYFFYYCDKLKKQTGIDLNIWGINHLENTDFKVGFAGLAPKFDKKRIYSLSVKNQAKLFGYVGGNVLKSPGYINQSMLDSLGSFGVRYLAPKRDYYHLFDYYKWDENEINSLLINEYGWEKAIDTTTTWRIGDGTASFYNYIYYNVAGFSEVDTFRSNQIREGMMTRDEALALINEENKPRYETLRWYLDIIGLDFSEVIKTVNKIPKRYKVEPK
jgi:asparagine synthetase B (glutamine-hydrolysing)